jgi:hypothetical protein
MPLRGLMIIAGALALALVVGGTVLVATVLHRLARPAPAIATAPLELPAGARIETMSLGGDRLVVDILLSDGTRRLVVIDLATGRQLGVIPLQTAP